MLNVLVASPSEEVLVYAGAVASNQGRRLVYFNHTTLES